MWKELEAYLALCSIKLGQTGEPGGDGGDRLADPLYDNLAVLGVHLLLPVGVHGNAGGGLDVLLVPGDHLVPQHRPQQGLDLEAGVREASGCGNH